MGETGRHRERRSAKRRPSVWKELFGLLVRVLLLAAFGYAFFTRVFLLAQVGGMDMFPALKDGDLALAFRLQQTYAKGAPPEAGGDAAFNLQGWNSSYTGEPIPAVEMREWLDGTVAISLRSPDQRVWKTPSASVRR